MPVMDPGDTPTSSVIKCFNCGCSCTALALDRSLSGTYLRSVKRKFDEFEEKSGLSDTGYARIDAENECNVLREMVKSQQLAIQDLSAELEEERNASASATDEAMSMILKLQREKAEIEMEARQFKRFAEERMDHDQQEMLALEELLYTREQTIESLLCKVKLYKHRLTTSGLIEAQADGSDKEETISRSTSISENLEGQLQFSQDIYPRLMCKTKNAEILIDDGDREAAHVEKYDDTPHSDDQLNDLEYRINQLERSPRIIHPNNEQCYSKNVSGKVVVGQTPQSPAHMGNVSPNSTSPPSIIVEEIVDEFPLPSTKLGSSLRRVETSHLDEKSSQKNMYNESEVGDDMNDRVYTIDSILQGDSSGGMNSKTVGEVSGDDYITTSRGSGARELEIQNLYSRLQALEADRETMRQTIISMGTDKAQLVLLREIAQKLCKDMPSSSRGMQSKQTAFTWASYVSLFKWVASFLIWRSKSRRCRYMFEESDNCIGLQMILDRSSYTKIPRLVSRIEVRHPFAVNSCFLQG